VPQALKSSLHNHYKGARHQCFNYSWTVVKKSGGRPLTAAHASREGHNKPITHLNELIDQGQLRPGDVIYSSRRPGADPSSRNLVYGPHWFVYIGDRQFADQYGTRDAEAMQAFVPGRKIDTIYHPFDI
jgi:hypothetical protein